MKKTIITFFLIAFSTFLFSQSTGGTITYEKTKTHVIIKNVESPYYNSAIPDKNQQYIWKYKWIINGKEYQSFEPSFQIPIDSIKNNKCIISRYAKFLMVLSPKSNINFELTNWLTSNIITVPIDLMSNIIINDESYDIAVGESITIYPETILTICYPDNTFEDVIITHGDTIILSKPIIEYLKVDFPLTVEQSTNDIDTKIFPNPAIINSTISLEIATYEVLSSNLHIAIVDNNGKAYYYSEIFPQTKTSIVNILLYGFTSQTYYLSVWGESKTKTIYKTQKIVVQ